MVFKKCPNCGEMISGKNKKCDTFGCFYELDESDYNKYLDNIELCKEISKSIFSPFINKLTKSLKGIENRMIHHTYNFDKNYDEIVLIETLISELDSVFYPICSNIKNFNFIVLAKEKISRYSFQNNYIIFAYIDLFFVKYEISSSIHDKYVKLNNIEYGFITERDSIKRNSKIRSYNDMELIFNNNTENCNFKYERVLKGDLYEMIEESKKLQLYKGIDKKIDRGYIENFKNNITTCINNVSQLYEDIKQLDSIIYKQKKAIFKNKKKINELKTQILEIEEKIEEEYNKIIEYYKKIKKDLKK